MAKHLCFAIVCLFFVNGMNSLVFEDCGEFSFDWVLTLRWEWECDFLGISASDGLIADIH